MNDAERSDRLKLPNRHHGRGGGPIAEPAIAGGGSSDRLDFQEISSIFRRRLGLFLIVLLVIFNTALFLTLNMEKRYSATAEIAIDRTGDQLAPKGSSVVDDENVSNDVDTEVQVLISRELAGKVVDTLGLINRASAPNGTPSPQVAGDPSERQARLRDAAIDNLRANLHVERIKSAFAMRITFTDRDPERTAAIANAYAEIYAQQQVDEKRQANARALEFLQNQIEQLRQQAQSDMQQLQDYRISNNLLSTTGASLTEQEISTYNQQVAMAGAQAAGDAAQLRTARLQLRQRSVSDDVGAALSSPVVQSLRVQRATLSARVADLASAYGESYPDLVDARSQLRDTDQQIQAEIQRVISNLEAQAQVSQQRLDSLRSSLGGARAALTQNNRAMVGLDDLSRRASTSQQVYESYLDRYKAVAAQSGTESAEARVLSHADVPGRPSSPNLMINLLLGLLIGAGAGAAAAIGTELFFNGLTSASEVEQRLGLRYLGGVPTIESVGLREATPLASVQKHPRSAYAESFRAILASLRLGRETRGDVIAVTSALPGEGKSTLAICLAAAESLGGGNRAVVIDCDAIRHRLSDQIVVDRTKPGLREVLRDGVAIDQALVQVGDSGLYVLPITTPFGADEQLSRGGLVRELISKLREFFPLIILDCPPLLPVAEAREIASLADDVILVAAWRKTSESALRNAIRALPPSIAARAGVVLTRINLKKQARFAVGDASAYYDRCKEYYAA